MNNQAGYYGIVEKIETATFIQVGMVKINESSFTENYRLLYTFKHPKNLETRTVSDYTCYKAFKTQKKPN